jgi:hypothetical protein
VSATGRLACGIFAGRHDAGCVWRPGAGWGGDGDLPGWVRVMRDQILAGPPGLLLCGLAAVMLWV